MTSTLDWLVLAPMEGLTDPPLRRVLTSLGHYDWCVTEFIRVTNHLVPDHIYHYYCPELHTQGKTASGTPVHIQLLGHDPSALAENAAFAAKLGAPAIDLNFGCPAKTVNRHRGGAVLLTEPELIHNIVASVRRAAPSHIPVSAKMRLGYEDDSLALENAQAIESAGASWLTIHARTKTDGYRPPAYWEKIQPIRDKIAIPIIANGEIWSVDDAVRARQLSGCAHLMLGRGAVTRPDLVRHLRGESTLLWPEIVAAQLQFLSSISKTETGLIGRYKQWLGMLTAGYPEAGQLWDQIKRERDLSTIINALPQFKDTTDSKTI